MSKFKIKLPNAIYQYVSTDIFGERVGTNEIAFNLAGLFTIISLAATVVLGLTYAAAWKMGAELHELALRVEGVGIPQMSMKEDPAYVLLGLAVFAVLGLILAGVMFVISVLLRKIEFVDRSDYQ